MNTIRKILMCAIVLSAIVAVYSLEDVDTKSKSVQDLIGGPSSDLARRRKHRFGHHLLPLLGIGGIHALSALVAIKFKLVLIFLAVLGSVFYGYKIYAGSSCPTPIIGESSGPIIPFEGYSSSFPGAYSTTYPGSDPYSGYSADHGISSYSADHGISAIPPGASLEAPSSSGPYRRISSASQKRSAEESSPLGLDFGELAFTLLGVESKVCRRRFICEMSVNYRRNPIVGSAYKMISRQFFPQYAIEIDQKAPKSVKECAMMYSGCRSPNDPIPEEETNKVDESVNAVGGAIEADNGTENDQSRSVKPKLDQVQRFVVGSKKEA